MRDRLQEPAASSAVVDETERDREDALPTARSGAPGLAIGVVTARSGGEAVVAVPGHPAGDRLHARVACDPAALVVGGEAAIAFEGADPMRPIVLGPIIAFGDAPGRARALDAPDRLVIEAGEELVLRCGAASLTLTRAGKVIQRGAYVSSRSSGVLRIKGGSVEIN